MNRRKFVVTSTVMMLLLAGAVAGLALYSNYIVKASIPGLPEAVSWLPADSQAVFGMNVQKFVASPVYARFEEKHGKEIGEHLAEFIAKTGVDPRRNLSYVIASGRLLESHKGEGIVIAVGQFNTAAITNFIDTQGTPIKTDYKGTTVLMKPEGDGSKVEKGIALISESEIALGDLESLKALLDVRSGSEAGILSNTTLAPLIQALNPEEMFWFAGDAARIMAKAPANTPLGGSISALQNIVGTLNLTDAVTGKIYATARDEESARKLADVARGVVALGQLAGDYQAELAEILKGVSVSQDKTQIRIVVNFPITLLDKLEEARPARKGAL